MYLLLYGNHSPGEETMDFPTKKMNMMSPDMGFGRTIDPALTGAEKGQYWAPEVAA